MIYSHLADVVVVLHLAFVLFLLGALLLILAGIPLRWQWTRNLWFRLGHLACIAYVAGQYVAGYTCPLTTLESHLRAQADIPLEGATAIGRMAHEVLFFQVSDPSVFMWPYIGFGLLVLSIFVFAPPRMRGARSAGSPPGEKTPRPCATLHGPHTRHQSRNAEKMRSNSPAQASSAPVSDGSN